MSEVFRGKFMALFKKAFEKGKLRFSGKAKAYAAESIYENPAFRFSGQSAKKQKLAQRRQLLGIAPQLAELENKSPQELMLELTGIDITLCPACKKGTLRMMKKLPKQPDVCLFDLFN